MVWSCDVGSLPFVGDFNRFLEAAEEYSNLHIHDDLHIDFEKKVVNSFVDKIETGIRIPTYPQFRNMNGMFLGLIDGIEKTDGGFYEIQKMSIREGKENIPEIASLRNNSRKIREKIGRPFQLRICITGPYTLSSQFISRDPEIFNRISNIILKIIEKNIFSSKNGAIELVVIDEPSFNFLDDPLLDYGNEGRENLLKGWERIFQKIRSKNVLAGLHLHKTGDELFWEVKSLDIIESHAKDDIYSSEKTKPKLESKDKFLKASICTTVFDDLIKNKLARKLHSTENHNASNQRFADIWKKIKLNQIDPKSFLESIELMEYRLNNILSKFGNDRILYSGPECGLMNFPTYGTALETLRRTAKATKRLEKRI